MTLISGIDPAVYVLILPAGFLIGWWLGGLLRRKPKPTWDGKHRLQFVKYVEIADFPDDFHVGWEWRCTCGTGTASYPFGLTHTESFAKLQFDKHEGLYR